MAEKPDDRFVLPMTPDEHAAQHCMNERKFWASHKIDAVMVALALHEVWVNGEIDDQYAAEFIMEKIIRGMRK
jgi:hypothetical protein